MKILKKELKQTRSKIQKSYKAGNTYSIYILMNMTKNFENTELKPEI